MFNLKKLLDAMDILLNIEGIPVIEIRGHKKVFLWRFDLGFLDTRVGVLCSEMLQIIKKMKMCFHLFHQQKILDISIRSSL